MSAPAALAATAVASSGDKKLTTDPERFPVAATYVAQTSCPTDCPFYGNGCYAESGRVGFTTRRLARAPRARPVELAKQEAARIEALEPREAQPLRLHVVGDARTAGAAVVLSQAARSWRARGGGAVWTYTHAWRTVPRMAWGTSVSVLASVESAADAARARARRYAAALVVDSRIERWRNAFQEQRAVSLGRGLAGIPCPQQTGTAPDCARCGLCFRGEALRKLGRVILFASHGATRKLSAALEALS